MFYFFFFNDTATTEIYTLSLHDALPISTHSSRSSVRFCRRCATSSRRSSDGASLRDRKSTRLNSSHGYISYAVFCLKKKKIQGEPGSGNEGLTRQVQIVSAAREHHFMSR